MKRTRYKIAACILLSLMLLFSACASKNEKVITESVESKDETNTPLENEPDFDIEKIEFGFFKSIIPEGFIESAEENSLENLLDTSCKIKAYKNESKSAKEEIEKSLKYWESAGEAHTRGTDVQIGEYTWMVEEFKWNDDTDSVTVYTDSKKGSAEIEISFFMMDIDNPIVIEFLKNFEEY